MWVAIFLLAVVAGLAAIGVSAWQLFGKVRSLGGTVARASERLAAAGAELDRIAPRDEA